MLKHNRNITHLFNERAFTLIELLVVISIISMLMSIMLPGLNNAREMGRSVVCQNNIRQLTVAWYSYALGNDDSLCSPDTLWNDGSATGNLTHHWVADGPYDPMNTVGGTIQAIEDGVLAPYLSYSAGVYKCKGDKTEMVRSYAISNTMGGRNWCIDCGYTQPFSDWARIDRPAQRLVFIDADSTASIGQRMWIIGGFWPVDWKDKVWWLGNYELNNITARHIEGCNFSFADTHCEYRRWKDKRTVDIANWDSSQDGQNGGNKDLEFFFEVLKGPND
ncbi:MAG: type II secretion system protein [Phycisphaerales bacterium]|jgi:prepilin-type N-terminal cleavage/methylation domain-containing protein/prepilin-type processing-associated H-X9-DG protein